MQSEEARMDDLTFVPADQFGLQTLTLAFNRGFVGYYVALTQTPATLAAMIETNDVSLADSCVVLDRDGAPAGIGLLGVRPPRGWVAGMGLAPLWRGQGQGSRLMRHLIARCHGRGLRALQLEVLDQNEPARRLYARLGFTSRRPLAVFNGSLDARQVVRLARHPPSTSPLAVADVLAEFDALHPEEPSWQRERSSLLHMAPRLQGLALRADDALVAYLLYNGAVFGRAVLDAGARGPTARQRVAHIRRLLALLMAEQPRAPVRAINVPPGDPLGEALAALGCPVTTGQQEMVLMLGG
jgi:ribosomal protein S18 acetylase RimI-like enzyme